MLETREAPQHTLKTSEHHTIFSITHTKSSIPSDRHLTDKNTEMCEQRYLEKGPVR